MGAEHSRRLHLRRHRQPTSMPPTNGTPPIVSDDQSKSLPPPNTELVRRKKRNQMDRLRRTLSFRSRKKGNSTNNNNNNNHTRTIIASTKNDNDTTTTAIATGENKLLQWQNDERAVRLGACSFNVKYLGSVEVQESRGMHICEQAIQALLNQKMKHIKAVLHISGDALRVVDETNKGLIVDQTIEKVSFCAPDRHHEKGFAYICRDGTTRRWLCHGFLAIKGSGERLSHAVGCAFQICLERKQKRDRECNVTVEYSQNGTSFTRFGSFRTTSITERLIDPQSAIIVEPVPHNSSTPNSINSSIQNSCAVERPRPKGNESDTFIRSASLRVGGLNQTGLGDFRRQTSLRPSDLPSIQEAKNRDLTRNTIPEEVEPALTTNEFNKLSLNNSAYTNGYQYQNNHFALPATKSPIIPSSYVTNTDHISVAAATDNGIDMNANLSSNVRLTNQTCIINDQEREQYDSKASIIDAFNSNLNALVQSNHPTNPFSPYGYSMAAQTQSPNINHRQPTIFTPKRGTNPFDDDLIRR